MEWLTRSSTSERATRRADACAEKPCVPCCIVDVRTKALSSLFGEMSRAEFGAATSEADAEGAAERGLRGDGAALAIERRLPPPALAERAPACLAEALV